MNILKLLQAINRGDLLFYTTSLSFTIYLSVVWSSFRQNLLSDCEYPIQIWFIVFFIIIVPGRIILYFYYRLNFYILIMLRFLFFLLIISWAVVGTIFWANLLDSLECVIFIQLPFAGLDWVLLVFVVFAYMIAFVLRRRVRRFRAAMMLNLQEEDFLEESRLSVQELKKLDKFMKNFQGTDLSCPICVDDFEKKEKVVVLPVCGHTYHSKCIKDWLVRNSTCPCCKRDVREYLS